MSFKPSQGSSVAVFVCLLLCIRLVGGFNGNANKTLCWSAVCAASGGSGMWLYAHRIDTERSWSPYQTSWKKGKGVRLSEDTLRRIGYAAGIWNVEPCPARIPAQAIRPGSR